MIRLALKNPIAVGLICLLLVAFSAVVTPRKIVRTGELWAGNPAVKMRDITEKDIESFRRSAAAYVRLGQAYRGERPKAAE